LNLVIRGTDQKEIQMADLAEDYAGPPAVDQLGNLTVWWVPTIADPSAPTAIEIGDTEAFRLTYSFTATGWTLAGTQVKGTDDRFTSPQTFETLGKTARTLDLGYVDSVAAGSAAVVLVENAAGFFVERRGVDQSELITAGDMVRVVPVKLGAQIEGPLDGTGKFTYMQMTAITGAVALVAVA
jgi:hypothetical protein